jgi:periplasmic nitrate reductase NapD
VVRRIIKASALPKSIDERGMIDMPVNNEGCEFHIAGVVVYARVESLDDVIHALETLPGAQIHGASHDGKIVLTFEGERSSHIAEQLSAAQAIPHVASVALVYQHGESIEPQPDETEIAK